MPVEDLFPLLDALLGLLSDARGLPDAEALGSAAAAVLQAGSALALQEAPSPHIVGAPQGVPQLCRHALLCCFSTCSVHAVAAVAAAGPGAVGGSAVRVCCMHPLEERHESCMHATLACTSAPAFLLLHAAWDNAMSFAGRTHTPQVAGSSPSWAAT